MKEISELLKDIKDLLQKQVLESKEVLRVEEAALVAGSVSISQIYHLMASGQIEYSKPSGKIAFISRKALINWMLSRPNKTSLQIDCESNAYVSTSTAKGGAKKWEG